MNPKHDLVALKIAGPGLGERNDSQPEAIRSTGLVLCLAWERAVRKTGRTNDLPSGGFDRVWRSLALKTSFSPQFMNDYKSKRKYHKYNDYYGKDEVAFNLREKNPGEVDKEPQPALKIIYFV
jgi:hypothetical protein